MKNLSVTEIVKKLIGEIRLAGDSSLDNDRFENLENMCELVNDLITEIDNVSYSGKNSHEYSVKRASDYAYDFLTNTVGINP
jgi:hypothetical protein